MPYLAEPPKQLERDNPDLIGGDSLSGSPHLDQNFMFRPLFRLLIVRDDSRRWDAVRPDLRSAKRSIR